MSGSSAGKKVLIGVLAAGVLTGGGCFAYWTAQRAALRAQVEPLGQALDALRPDPAPARPVPFGEPQPGDAADLYEAVEHVLGPRSGRTGPPPPGVADLPLPPGERPDPGALDALTAVLAGEAAASPALAAALSAYRPLVPTIRAGVHRGRCGWSWAPRLGLRSPVPDLMALRRAGLLLADRAARAEPAEAVRLALEHVFLGRDLARLPLVMPCVGALAIMWDGLDSLERALQRPLAREDYALVVEALARLEPLRVEDAQVGEVLALRAECLAMGGLPLAPTAAAASAAGGSTSTSPLAVLVAAQAMEELTSIAAAQREAISAPYPDRAALFDRVARIVRASSSPVIRVATINYQDLCRQVDALHARRDLLRIVAAAHLTRLDTGAFRVDAATLAPHLGGALPQDPFRPAPYVLEVVGGELRAHSVGVDEAGGHPRLAKLRVTARAPQ